MGLQSARVVIVGGRSRSGRAIRAAMAGSEVIAAVLGNAGPGEIALADYAEVPDGLDLAGAVIINCAGAVSGTPDELMRANCTVPLAWARAGADRGASRFVQISSFSLFGHQPAIGHATPPAPASAYGRSKLAAERALAASARPSWRVSRHGFMPAFFSPTFWTRPTIFWKTARMAKVCAQHWPGSSPRPGDGPALRSSPYCHALPADPMAQAPVQPLHGGSMKAFGMNPWPQV